MFSRLIDNLFGRPPTETHQARLIDAAMTAQLRAHFEKIQRPIELAASLDDQPKSVEMRRLLGEIGELSDKITILDETEPDARQPSFTVAPKGEAARIRFAGPPLGHELSSLVLAILHCSGHPPKVAPEILERIRGFQASRHFETYITLSCHNCPDVVQTLNLMAAINPNIRHTIIDGAVFRREIDWHKIEGVPTVLLDGKPFSLGRKPIEELVTLLEA